MRTVTVGTKEVGERLGVTAVIRDARTRRKLATTGVRPYDFGAAVHADAETIARERGWKLAGEGGL